MTPPPVAIDAADLEAALAGLEAVDWAGAAVRLVGFGLLAGATAAAIAFLFRWYSSEEIPEGVAVLAGVTTVAGWLNTKSALGDAIIGETSLLDPTTAVYTVLAFVVSAIAADAGRRLGDVLARDVFAVAATRSVDDVADLVRSAGRVVGVDLPETIGDAEGYDAVDAETKAALAGRTLLFPRRLERDELEARLVARLERDFGVGYVDATVTEDGTVESLAVGSRQSGIGATLAPGSVAVAIRADPSPDASPGDAVEVWVGGEEPDEDADGSRESPRRVTGAELRATADDVATLSVDGDDVDALEADRTYRLVTLPGTPDVTRELVTRFRDADETVTVERVDPDGPLEGEPVGSLPVTVLAIERDDDVLALPDADVALEAGDVAHVLGTPAAIGRLKKLKRTRTRERRRERVRGEAAEQSGGSQPDSGAESRSVGER